MRPVKRPPATISFHVYAGEPYLRYYFFFVEMPPESFLPPGFWSTTGRHFKFYKPLKSTLKPIATKYTDTKQDISQIWRSEPFFGNLYATAFLFPDIISNCSVTKLPRILFSIVETYSHASSSTPTAVKMHHIRL